MIDEKSGYLFKAREALSDAQNAIEDRRYDNAANRAYYACFFAAIAALIDAHIHPTGAWEHDYVQAQFAGLLVHRRKLYPAELRDVLLENHRVRREADYKPLPVSEKNAKRAVAKANSFVQTVVERTGGKVR